MASLSESLSRLLTAKPNVQPSGDTTHANRP